MLTDITNKYKQMTKAYLFQKKGMSKQHKQNDCGRLRLVNMGWGYQSIQKCNQSYISLINISYWFYIYPLYWLPIECLIRPYWLPLLLAYSWGTWRGRAWEKGRRTCRAGPANLDILDLKKARATRLDFGAECQTLTEKPRLLPDKDNLNTHCPAGEAERCQQSLL